jgi:pimeloyl-ACP methyl ester carboxylesterase
MTFEKNTVSLPSGEVTYMVGGDGPPVLYFHSAGGARITRGLELLAANFRIHILVIPGFDDTPLLDSVKDMKDIADLGAEFIDAVIKEPCDVMGQSFGGWVVPWLALEHPDKIGQLVMQCPAGFRPEGSAAPSSDPEDRLRQMYAYPDKRPVETKSDETLERNRSMLHHYHGAAVRDEDLIARLGEIEKLTLLMLGTKDGRMTPESVQLIKERVQRAFLIYVYDAAHNIEVDQPERFAALAGDFLKRGEVFLVNQKSDDDQTALHSAAG